MIRKSLIAASTVAALVAAIPAQQAQAGVDIDFHIGAPGFYPDYDYGYGHPVRHWDNRINCQKGKQIVRWNGFHKVNAVDCSLPRYKYTGWKAGQKYLVTVNRRGGIADVDRY